MRIELYDGETNYCNDCDCDPGKDKLKSFKIIYDIEEADDYDGDDLLLCENCILKWYKAFNNKVWENGDQIKREIEFKKRIKKALKEPSLATSLLRIEIKRKTMKFSILLGLLIQAVILYFLISQYKVYEFIPFMILLWIPLFFEIILPHKFEDDFPIPKESNDSDFFQKIRSIPEIESKTQSDLKELRDFTDIQKVCKLRPMGDCLDMFNYGGECCEAKCPVLDSIKSMKAFLKKDPESNYCPDCGTHMLNLENRKYCATCPKFIEKVDLDKSEKIDDSKPIVIPSSGDIHLSEEGSKRFYEIINEKQEGKEIDLDNVREDITKGFNEIQKNNDERHEKWYEIMKDCKDRDQSICNNQDHWDHGEAYSCYYTDCPKMKKEADK